MSTSYDKSQYFQLALSMLYGQENPTSHMELELTETTKGGRQPFWSTVKVCLL
jgi:hypothetical protein